MLALPPWLTGWRIGNSRNPDLKVGGEYVTYRRAPLSFDICPLRLESTPAFANQGPRKVGRGIESIATDEIRVCEKRGIWLPPKIQDRGFFEI